MEFLETINKQLNRIMLFIGGLFLVAMIFLTCGNILFRLVWLPIRGTFELMGFFGAMITVLALAHTQRQRGHIAVDVLINTFSATTRKVLAIINSVICAAFFSMAAWQLAYNSSILRATGEITETLRIIYYPFTYIAAFGCAVLALEFVLDLIRLIPASREVSH